MFFGLRPINAALGFFRNSSLDLEELQIDAFLYLAASGLTHEIDRLRRLEWRKSRLVF